MAREKKQEKIYDDDGRTIADMSGVSAPGMFGHLPKGMTGSNRGKRDVSDTEKDGDHSKNIVKIEPQPPFTGRETRKYTFAALKAGMLIGMVYLAGICALIGILYLAWKVL